MTAIALATAGFLRVVQSRKQLTGVAAENITIGQAVRLDTTNGKFTLSKGTSSAEARFFGIALRTATAGEAMTALCEGIVDGYDLGALDYDAPVYLSDTDGTLADGAGTVEVQLGRVVPGQSTLLGQAYDKMLWVEPHDIASVIGTIGTSEILKKTSVTLTSAQVKALKATPITLVAAPGADKAVVPVAVNIVVNYGGTNAFTESADDFSIGYAAGAEIKEIESTGFIDQTNDEWRYITFEHAETFIPEENVAVVITNLDDEIAGNAAGDNSVLVELFYRIVATDI